MRYSQLRYSQQLSHKHELRSNKQDDRRLVEILIVIWVVIVIITCLIGLIYG